MAALFSAPDFVLQDPVYVRWRGDRGGGRILLDAEFNLRLYKTPLHRTFHYHLLIISV